MSTLQFNLMCKKLKIGCFKEISCHLVLYVYSELKLVRILMKQKLFLRLWGCWNETEIISCVMCDDCVGSKWIALYFKRCMSEILPECGLWCQITQTRIRLHDLQIIWPKARKACQLYWNFSLSLCSAARFPKHLPYLVHSCRKHKFVTGFCCWLYLACVAGVKRGKGRQSGWKKEDMMKK